MSITIHTPENDATSELSLSDAQAKIGQLETALQSSRTIGIAVGIIVERLKVSHEQAFELLVHISQHDNRKLRDIAADLVFSGTIPTP